MTTFIAARSSHNQRVRRKRGLQKRQEQLAGTGETQLLLNLLLLLFCPCSCSDLDRALHSSDSTRGVTRTRGRLMLIDGIAGITIRGIAMSISGVGISIRGITMRRPTCGWPIVPENRHLPSASRESFVAPCCE